MPTHKEFTAWIIADGRKLPEYKVTAEEDGRKVACFIPSMPGQKFSVHWRDEGSNTFTAGYIQCDGFITPGRYLSGQGEQMRSGIRSGPETERPFMFAEIPKSTTRNSSKVKDPKLVGTIILKIMQAQRGPPRESNPLCIAPGGLSKDWISTTGGHCATFSREEVRAPLQSPTTWTTKPIDPDDPRSYVKFVFHYRTMDWLVKHRVADPKDASLHLGNKVQFSVSPQRLPDSKSQDPSEPPPAAPEPIDMKIAQENTLNPEKKGKERSVSSSKPKKEKKPKPPKSEEPTWDDSKPFVDPRLTVDVEELKRKYAPHLLDPTAPIPPSFLEESDNQKRKRERARRQAEREAREAERLEKEKNEVMERRKASAARQHPSRQFTPMHSQHSLPDSKHTSMTLPEHSRPQQAASTVPQHSQSQPQLQPSNLAYYRHSSQPQPSQSNPAYYRQASQPQPQHHPPSQPRSQPQPHQPPQLQQIRPQTVQYIIPAGHYPASRAQLQLQAQRQILGHGRPPIAARSASASQVTSAGGSSTRIFSGSSANSYASSTTATSAHGHSYEVEYDSEPEHADPGPALRRTRTMPIVPSHGSGQPGMDYRIRRDFSTASHASMYDVPGSSQETYVDDFWSDDDMMDMVDDSFE